MPDYGFYIARKKEETDLPPRSPDRFPGKLPDDLPSPRHRPGEPIMYDPPKGTDLPLSDPAVTSEINSSDRQELN